MGSFEEYVAGRTVAIVGPAPVIADQSADIEAHDLVYRLNFPNGVPREYGRRIDILYLNRGRGITMLEDDQTHVRLKADPAAWWVFKSPHGHRPDGPYRRAIAPPIGNPNAATGALYDLLQFDIAYVTVYGVDLYAGGPEAHYHPDYPNLAINTSENRAEAIFIHRPEEQRAIHQACVATGKVRGDRRYLNAVRMSDDEYQARLDLWEPYRPKVNTAA